RRRRGDDRGGAELHPDQWPAAAADRVRGHGAGWHRHRRRGAAGRCHPRRVAVGQHRPVRWRVAGLRGVHRLLPDPVVSPQRAVPAGGAGMKPALTLLAVAAVALLLGPRLDPGTQDLVTTLLVYLAVAQAWNILSGFAGQVSLGSAAFVA